MLLRGLAYVWRVRLGDSACVSEPQIESLSGMLSAEERRKADAFRGVGLRRDYILAHAALRCVLGQCMGISPSSVYYAAGSIGEKGVAAIKPRIAQGTEAVEMAQDLRFNLSHTSGAALIGVAVGRELGIDIERQRLMDDLDAMARSVLSAEEWTLWEALAGGDRIRAFYQVWTRKESYLKAIGLGLYRDPREVIVPVGVDLRLLSTRQSGIVHDRRQNGVWRVADIAVSEGYFASICCEGEGMPEIMIHDFEFGDIF